MQQGGRKGAAGCGGGAEVGGIWVAGQGAQPDLTWSSSPVLGDSNGCFQARAKGRISGLHLEVTPVTPMLPCACERVLENAPGPARRFYTLSFAGDQQRAIPTTTHSVLSPLTAPPFLALAPGPARADTLGRGCSC